MDAIFSYLDGPVRLWHLIVVVVFLYAALDDIKQRVLTLVCAELRHHEKESKLIDGD